MGLYWVPTLAPALAPALVPTLVPILVLTLGYKASTGARRRKPPRNYNHSRSPNLVHSEGGGIGHASTSRSPNLNPSLDACPIPPHHYHSRSPNLNPTLALAVCTSPQHESFP